MAITFDDNVVILLNCFDPIGSIGNELLLWRCVGIKTQTTSARFVANHLSNFERAWFHIL
jgi:hypothetical protein